MTHSDSSPSRADEILTVAVLSVLGGVLVGTCPARFAALLPAPLPQICSAFERNPKDAIRTVTKRGLTSVVADALALSVDEDFEEVAASAELLGRVHYVAIFNEAEKRRAEFARRNAERTARALAEVGLL